MSSKIIIVDETHSIINHLCDLSGINGQPVELIEVEKEKIYEKSKVYNPKGVVIDSSVLENDGSKALKSLKQDRHTLDIPVILITPLFDSDKIKFYFDIGISDFIFKPFKAEELVLRLETIFNRNYYINELLEANEHLSNLSQVAKNIGNAVIIFYPDGEIEWVNEGFKEIYGLNIEEYLSKYHHEIFSEGSKKLKNALNQFKNNEKTTGLAFEHEITTPQHNKWIQTTLNPVYNEQKYLVKIIAVESDITDLREEKKKSDELLLNILPFEVAEQLKKKGQARTRKYKMVSILFADFENFTSLTRIYSTKDLIYELNQYIQKFDEILDKHFVEKIKTIGDAYMCAGGLPLKNRSNPIDVTLVGLEFQKVIKDMGVEKEKEGKEPWNLRLGIHTGEVTAGVIGSKKFAYDIWGKAVNTASRMEDTSAIGKVNVSGITYSYIADYFECTYRGKIKVKNIDEEIDMYFVDRLKPEYSKDPEGIYPNAEFMKILAKY
ncbi:MAG: adenylate/guanylate cyclase domain-containing protein [Bacteroidales bacterium]